MPSNNQIIEEIKSNIVQVDKLLDLLNQPPPQPRILTDKDTSTQKKLVTTKYFKINLAIDHVDDIFDDFDEDPDIIETRTISDDFIDAIKQRYRFTFKRLSIKLIFKPFFRHRISERVILKTLKEQIKLKKREFFANMLFKLFVCFAFLIIGAIVLLKLPYFKNVLNNYMGSDTRAWNEILMILGWVGIWEGITRTVDFLTNDLKMFSFLAKLNNANFILKFK